MKGRYTGVGWCQLYSHRIESQSYSGTIKSQYGYGTDTGKQDCQPLGGHSESFSCLSFSSDGKYLASGSEDKTTTIWDMNEREAKTGPLRKHTRSWGDQVFSSRE